MKTGIVPHLLVEYLGTHGFPIIGAVDIELAFETGRIQQHLKRYADWLDTGNSGSMTYLKRGQAAKENPRLLFPDAESVFCVAVPYPSTPAGSLDAKIGPRYARYLSYENGRDYHEVIREQLETTINQFLALTALSTLASPLKWKICVDTSAVLERAWAELAGLGWIGKNTLLIHPKEGSYLFLAEIFINQKTGIPPRPFVSRCGHCDQCINACPTGALNDDGILNANRCISYWTLEHRGELALTNQDKKAIGTWIAGCDLCQEACPFNRKISLKNRGNGENLTTPAASVSRFSWSDLFEESEAQYLERVRHSAFNRVKPAQFRRNLAVAFENSQYPLKKRG